MNKKIVKIDNFNLHFFNSSQFRSIQTMFYFRRKLIKEEVTKTNLLFSILSHSSKNYPNELLFERRKEELYGTTLNTHSYNKKNFSIDILYSSSLMDKYTEEGNYFSSLLFIKELLFNPNISENGFDEKAFDVAAMRIRKAIIKEKENERKLVDQKLLEAIDPDANFSINRKGYLKDLAKIDRFNLYQYYKDYFNSVEIDIYIYGNVDEEKIEEFLRTHFKFNNKTPEFDKSEYVFKDFKMNEIIEKKKGIQSILKIAYQINNTTEFEDLIVSKIVEIMLSGDPNSRFFTNIREKYSLCYYVDISIFITNHLAVVTSEMDKTSYEKIKELIEIEMDALRSGDFSLESIENAIKIFNFQYKELYQHPLEYSVADYLLKKLNGMNIEEIIENINKVTKEDIMNYMKKLSPHTIYLFGGDK